MSTVRLLAFLTVLPLAPALAIEVDGRIDPDEWSGARHVTDFRKTQPLNGEPGSLPTEAWILATPDGLAIAFRNVQPASVPRTRQRVQRDFDEQVDRVNLMVDFDGDGRTAYNFTVSSTDDIYDAIISNESSFNDDWDGDWRHAVAEDADGWSVEMLVPWHIAPMRGAEGELRTLGLYLDRVVGATGERMAWPLASYERPRFVSEFAPVELRKYSQSLLAITPYASALYDKVDGSGETKFGGDVFWKPNGQFQLTATVNPDFGQVESDDLVVNFDATEIFFSDKRPFFTENQGLFEFTTPSDYSQLLYTRRIGGPADDGSGAADIDAALKLNGSFGATKYGVFSAEEAGEAGRSFQALRLVRDFPTQNLGLMATHVDRPFLDREATVVGIDHDWRPTPRWNVRTRLIGSDIRDDGATARDTGATVWADYEMDRGWRQQWIAMHFGDELELNDAGYLARNSTNYAHWQVQRRFTELPADSRYAAKDWRWRVSGNYNDHGERLNHQFRISRDSQLRNGSSEYAQINVNSARVDDLLTRGNGPVRLPPSFGAYVEYSRPRKGDWAHELEAELYGGGLAGNDRLGYSLAYTPLYFVSDALNVYLGGYLEHTPSWLVWQRDTLIGEYDAREAHIDAGFTWLLGRRQELRLKLQAIALEGELRQAYRIAPDGEALASAETVDDLSVRTLGVQLRYRYELAPLSFLYVVYGRGGYAEDPYADQGTGALLGDAFDLRDDEQLLVKLSYRFEI
ncbi:DUF5916 domain-containing protein [Coralloluteibacterium stylophorae]|uniref:DUF5916 domain-containing protein n=3 Tax=Coralloluteibacterium stylophorae TaxID=1776034 RepID=A0AAP2C6L0_9GAMM|nr:DUF5916 domain-containing protein [Coralloluteibacterium stylophorae]MBS7455576.1 hypothetical protein [Coralloluteibacterium stylophorae]